MNKYDEFAVLTKAWRAPQELGHSVPRPVKLNNSGLTLAVLAALLFLGSIAVALLLWQNSSRASEQVELLQREAVDVDARITRLWRTSGGESKHNRVAYEFEAGGKTHHKEMKIPSRIWKTLKAGATLPVRYLPSKPEMSHPTALPKRSLSIWVVILVPAGMIVLGLGIVAALRRSMGLLENGRPAPAVVTKVTKVQSAEGGSTTVVEYEFPLMSGGIGKGKCSSSPKGVQKGSTISIVYDPNNPRRAARYPMQLVKVDRN